MTQAVWVAHHGAYDFAIDKQRYYEPEPLAFHCTSSWMRSMEADGFSVHFSDAAAIDYPNGSIRNGVALCVYKESCPSCVNKDGGINECQDHYRSMVMWTADADDPFAETFEECT